MPSAHQSIYYLKPWLDEVQVAVNSDLSTENKQQPISFAAYHSIVDSGVSVRKCHNTMLPLLPDEVNSPSTVRHLFNVIGRITSEISAQPSTCDY